MNINENERIPMACMLTTTDNPWDPFDQFDQWFMYDIEHGYQTCERLAKFAHTADGFTDEENAIIIEDAIDHIVATCPVTFADGTMLYKKVSRPLD